MATAAVLDLSDVGRQVAVGVRRLFDNAETNHRRYGDPAYFAPSMMDVQVIDTTTGAADRVGTGLMNVRTAAFTQNGARLALLTAVETSAGLPVTTVWIYEVAGKRLTQVPRSTGVEVAANSDLSWTLDGTQLLVALRDPENDKAAQASFKTLINGPVVVQTSAPFLDWDGMNRANRRRALAQIDPVNGTKVAVLATTAISSYQFSRDGSFVTWLEDSTEKTSYDVIGGTDNAVRTMTRGRAARTVLDAKTLKTTQPRWSDDRRTLAYTDKGEVFVKGVDDEKPRSITPKPKVDLSAKPPAEDDWSRSRWRRSLAMA